jgi:mannose/cellobiose epimerase-like protein (N-acyl-D-glucosamine 2-epimerase family)
MMDCLHNNEKGWMDNNGMDLWLKTCYVQRPGGFFRQQKSLLVLDSMRAHISDISKATFYRLLYTLILQ